MKLWQNLRAKFASDTVTATKVVDLLNKGYSLMQISGDLYNIPEIRTAINFIAEKVASVAFKHVREDDAGNVVLVKDRVNYVLTIRTNPKQGPQVFVTHMVTRLFLHNNCFIMPEWNSDGSLKWLYVLPFAQFEFLTDAQGRTLIRFLSNDAYTFYYDDIIHLQRFPGEKGGASRQATGNYIEIVNNIESQAVNDAKTSGRIAALLQVKTALKGTDMLKKLNEFKDLFLNSENTTGFGMIGAEYDVHKLDLKINPLNKELLNDIIKALYNYFGVSPEIINNAATELSYEQFIDNTIKPVVYQIEEEYTYKLFTENETYHNNKVIGEIIDLEISTLSAKTVFFDKMLFHGVFSRNEVRRRLYMGRVKGLDEYRTNLNSVATDKINQYQGVEGGGTDENGQGATQGTEQQASNTV